MAKVVKLDHHPMMQNRITHKKGESLSKISPHISVSLYFLSSTSEAGAGVANLKTDVTEKMALPGNKRVILGRRTRSVRIPRSNTMQLYRAGNKNNPLKGPLRSLSPARRAAGHVYVRLCKPPFESTNHNAAAAARPIRSRLFRHFVPSYIKVLYMSQD